MQEQAEVSGNLWLGFNTNFYTILTHSAFPFFSPHISRFLQKRNCLCENTQITITNHFTLPERGQTANTQISDERLSVHKFPDCWRKSESYSAGLA